MEELMRIKDIILNGKEDYIIETKNKETGWVGCASFHTNGEDKIIVFEGNSDGSDDRSHTYEEFMQKYDYEFKKEGK